MCAKKAGTIGIILNPRKKEVRAPLQALDTWLDSHYPDLEVLLCTFDSPFVRKNYRHFSMTSAEEVIKRAELIITLGGDGTILRTVQLVAGAGTPVLGVNLGGLGFLADTSPENFIEHLQSFLSGQYIIENRVMLKCHVLDSDQTFHAFNDLVIDKAGFSRVIEIVTYVDNRLLNSYIADALILSTPTGSTGYSLSAGGPIVIPETSVFLINPICPHSLTNRPVVVPDSSTIQLDVFTEFKEVNLFRDGQMVQSYPGGTSFQITRSEWQVKLIKMESRGFYETLRSKLHWGEDFRNKDRWSYKNSLK